MVATYRDEFVRPPDVPNFLLISGDADLHGPDRHSSSSHAIEEQSGQKRELHHFLQHLMQPPSL